MRFMVLASFPLPSLQSDERGQRVRPEEGSQGTLEPRLTVDREHEPEGLLGPIEAEMHGDGGLDPAAADADRVAAQIRQDDVAQVSDRGAELDRDHRATLDRVFLAVVD